MINTCLMRSDLAEVCEAGHESHRTRVVPSALGTFEVFDTERYRDTRGYCTGDQVCSRQIAESGTWETWETAAVTPFLRGGFVFDFGTNVGWYTRLALNHGCHVVGFDADYENLEVCGRNADRAGGGDRTSLFHAWITAGSPTWTCETVVDLIKVDIEGQDAAAVDVCWPMITAGQVRALLIEVSPCFAEGYPEMVQRLADVGFVAHRVQPEVRPVGRTGADLAEWVAGVNQIDLLFVGPDL